MHLLIIDLLVRPELSPAEQIFLVAVFLIAGCTGLRLKLRIVVLFLTTLTFLIDFEIMFAGTPTYLAIALFQYPGI